jgi:histidinol-phosphate/aromatic aminotransferase/cobyric acid decarboxylase-like protein
MMRDGAFHGGRFFEAIGPGFDALDREQEVISADVLDAWFDPAPEVLTKLREFLPFLLRTSPPIYAEGLVTAIARARDLPEAAILAGAGVSSLLFSCLPRLVGAGQRALILDPMYGEYRYLLETVLDAAVIRYPLLPENNFEVPLEPLLDQINQIQPRILCIVNPNNPTGHYWRKTDLLRLLTRIESHTLVLVDESYLEYVDASESLEPVAARLPNVLVVKSLSKVYALSGARVAYLVAHPDQVKALSRWIPPWAVSLPAQVAAVEALNCAAYYQHCYRQTRLFRQELASALHALPGVHVFPSCANFLLVDLGSERAEQLLAHLREKQIYIRNCRDMSARFGDRYVRVAVKTPSQNQRVAAAIVNCDVVYAT